MIDLVDDWEHFEIGGKQYLAVANHHDFTSHVINSKVYEFCPAP